MMTLASRTLLFVSISPIALAAPALAQENQAAAQTPQAQAQAESPDEQTIIVTGTRRADRTVADSPVPVDVIGSDAIENTGADGDQQDPQPAGSVVQLPAAFDRRRFRRASPGDPARPEPRPDAGPRQRQAPPRIRAAQHQRHGRPRQRRRRHQPHPRHRDQPRRGAARRRGRAIWLGRDRGRHQHPAEERRPRRARQPDLRRISHEAGRRGQGDGSAARRQRAADPESGGQSLFPRQYRR